MAKIVLDGVTRDVVVERNQAETTVVVDGHRYVVREIVALSGSLSFLIDNISFTAFVSTTANGTQLSLNGRTYLRAVARMDTDTPARSSSGVRDGRVQAPMPG